MYTVPNYAEMNRIVDQARTSRALMVSKMIKKLFRR